jgi:hypothetical protein
MDSRETPDGLLIQFQEFTWTPDGVHQDAWLSVTTSVKMSALGVADIPGLIHAMCINGPLPPGDLQWLKKLSQCLAIL